MNRIRETITALTSEDGSGVARVTKEERTPMSDERFQLILKCIVSVALIIAGTVLFLSARPEDSILLVALVAMGGIIYAGIKIK